MVCECLRNYKGAGDVRCTLPAAWIGLVHHCESDGALGRVPGQAWTNICGPCLTEVQEWFENPALRMPHCLFCGKKFWTFEALITRLVPVRG
jgi:hypothetical protein